MAKRETCMVCGKKIANVNKCYDRPPGANEGMTTGIKVDGGYVHQRCKSKLTPLQDDKEMGK